MMQDHVGSGTETASTVSQGDTDDDSERVIKMKQWIQDKSPKQMRNGAKRDVMARLGVHPKLMFLAPTRSPFRRLGMEQDMTIIFGKRLEFYGFAQLWECWASWQQLCHIINCKL
jgi:hypothetical protein